MNSILIPVAILVCLLTIMFFFLDKRVNKVIAHLDKILTRQQTHDRLLSELIPLVQKITEDQKQLNIRHNKLITRVNNISYEVSNKEKRINPRKRE